MKTLTLKLTEEEIAVIKWGLTDASTTPFDAAALATAKTILAKIAKAKAPA